MAGHPWLVDADGATRLPDRWSAIPAGAGRFRPVSALFQPGMRWSPEKRMVRSCEALSPDILGGPKCSAFTPERWRKRRC
jgi:hypothetical protein